MFSKGFTLLEVLIVVVVAVVVTMFAVPSYKKSQDRGRYMAASGVLVELGNAAVMVREQYPGKNWGATSVTANSSATTCPDAAPSSLMAAMQGCKFLNKIVFDGGKFMGYSYKVNPNGSVSCGKCMGTACMSGSNLNAQYTCAAVDKMGNLTHN